MLSLIIIQGLCTIMSIEYIIFTNRVTHDKAKSGY